MNVPNRPATIHEVLDLVQQLKSIMAAHMEIEKDTLALATAVGALLVQTGTVTAQEIERMHAAASAQADQKFQELQDMLRINWRDL